MKMENLEEFKGFIDKMQSPGVSKKAQLIIPLIEQESLDKYKESLFIVAILLGYGDDDYNEYDDRFAVYGNVEVFGKLLQSFSSVMTDPDFDNREVIHDSSRNQTVIWTVDENDGTGVMDNIIDVFVNEYEDRINKQNNDIDKIVMDVYEMFNV